MAIAAQTQAVRLELVRQLNIVAKQAYALESQSYAIAQIGPEFDTAVADLLTALSAAGYSTTSA